MERECSRCGGWQWLKRFDDTYTGHKGQPDRSDTEKTVYECRQCGAEGRRFVDGVDGTMTFSGAMRA
jgi:hypothetical protein